MAVSPTFVLWRYRLQSYYGDIAYIRVMAISPTFVLWRYRLQSYYGDIAYSRIMAGNSGRGFQLLDMPKVFDLLQSKVFDLM